MVKKMKGLRILGITMAMMMAVSGCGAAGSNDATEAVTEAQSEAVTENRTEAVSESEAEKNGFSIDEEAKGKVLSICKTIAGNPEAGNGRFCRNLVEGAILGYAGRGYGYGVETAEKDCVLRADDFTVPEFINEEEEKGVIGFRM